MPQVFQIFEVRDGLNAGREVYAAYFPPSFQGKSWWKVRWVAAQKIRFEFHTGDYGCRFRPWRFDSVPWSTAVPTGPQDNFNFLSLFFFFILNIIPSNCFELLCRLKFGPLIIYYLIIYLIILPRYFSIYN